MNLQEIKDAIARGETVHWSNDNYMVILDSKGQYLIDCILNGYCVGLTWLDGITMNGKESEFYIK